MSNELIERFNTNRRMETRGYIAKSKQHFEDKSDEKIVKNDLENDKEDMQIKNCENNQKIDELIDEALTKKANYLKKSKRDLKTVRYNPQFSNMSMSRKRSKLQVDILSQLFEEDPEWGIDTYIKAAEAVGISPTQAYKWGYHQKQRSNYCKTKSDRNIRTNEQTFKCKQKNVEKLKPKALVNESKEKFDNEKYKYSNGEIHSEGELYNEYEPQFLFCENKDDSYFENETPFILSAQISSSELMLDDEHSKQLENDEKEFCLPMICEEIFDQTEAKVSWIESLFN